MGIDLKDVTCVIVTRNGDTEEMRLLLEYLDLFSFKSISIFDNLRTLSNTYVYGRYVPILNEWAKQPVTYVQDDDCLVDIPEVLAHYEPGVVTCNIRHTHADYYTESKFGNIAPVGWGAIFDRDLVYPAFNKYWSSYTRDDLFLRECDRIFTGLNRVKRITAGCVNLPWAHGADRMCNEARHKGDFSEIVGRVRKLTAEDEVGR